MRVYLDIADAQNRFASCICNGAQCGDQMAELASYVTASGLLMIASIMLGRTTNRIGVPALLAFLGLGMIAGEQGIGRIAFSDYRLSFNLGTLALLVILFDGGLNTPVKRVREAIAPAALLATIG